MESNVEIVVPRDEAMVSEGLNSVESLARGYISNLIAKFQKD